MGKIYEKYLTSPGGYMNSRKLTVWFGCGLAVWYVVNTLCVSVTPCAVSFLTASVSAGCALVLLCAFRLIPGGPAAYAVAMAIICAGVFEAVWGICQLIGVVSSNHHLYAVTGTFGNPGPYGGFLAVSASVGLGICKEKGNNLLWGAVILICCMTVASMSRGAMLALGMSAVILWREEVKRSWKPVVAVGAALAVALYFLKRGSADGRLEMLLTGVSAWSDSFWLGSGNGSFLHSLSEAQIRHHEDGCFHDAGVAEYPFCEPLHVAVEFGFVGLLLYCGMVAFALAALWRTGSAAFYGLLALTVFSLFSYPFSLWEFVVLQGALIAAAAASEGKGSRIAAITEGIAGVALACAALIALHPYVETRREYARFSFIRSGAFIKDYREFLPRMMEDSRFLFAYGQILREEGRLNESNAALRLCAAVSNDPMPRILMGRNHEDMGDPETAEEMYLQAHHMQPARIYPLFRLMKLHEGRGENERAADYASRISAVRPKVESPATRDMRREADRYLRFKKN